MESRYGIHTIECFYRLSRKWFDIVFETLKASKAGKFYLDETYCSDTGMKKYISTAFSKCGVVIYLYRQKRSQNKTKKNLSCSVRFRLNPLSLVNGKYQPKGVFKAREEQLADLESQMDALLQELGLSITFEELTLSRVDCCLDLFPDSQEWVDEALRVLRRSKVMKSYKENRFPKDDPHHKEKNNHSWRVRCKTTTITAYDKTFQLLEEELIETYDAPMLRFEISRTSAKFKRGLSNEIKGSNQKILHTIMKDSEKTIQQYLQSIHANETFVKYEECMRQIATVKSKTTRKHMKTLAEKLSDCKTYRQAVENSGLSASQLRAVEKAFHNLGISPITLRNSAPFDKLQVTE